MSDDATPLDIAERYRPLIALDALHLLVEACTRAPDFCALARRDSSVKFMVDAVRSTSPLPLAKIDEWIVKVIAHYLNALVGEQPYPGMLDLIAHEDFLLGECPRWSLAHVSEECPLQDGTDASVWMDGFGDPTGQAITFHNVLVRDYFVARYIADVGANLLLRFEYPQRWVLMFLATLAPDLLTSLAATRSDRIRADIELEVEQKVQAALSHQLKRSAGAVRSHLKKIRRKLSDTQFVSISDEYDRIIQEVTFQVALAERTSMWSAQPELHIEEVAILPEIQRPRDHAGSAPAYERWSIRLQGRGEPRE